MRLNSQESSMRNIVDELNDNLEAKIKDVEVLQENYQALQTEKQKLK